MNRQYHNLLTVLKGSAFLGSAEIAVRTIGFFVSIYIARVFGVAVFGKLSFAIATSAYFALLSVLGLDIFGTREVAAHSKNIPYIVGRITTIRAFLSAGAFLLMLLFAMLIPKPADVKLLLVLTGLPIFLGFLSIEWVFQGREKMGELATARVIRQVIYAGLVFLLISNPQQVYLVPIFITAGLVAMLAYLWQRYLSTMHIELGIDKDYYRFAMRSALPIGIAGFMITIYHSSDTLMLSFMKSDTAVGIYNAAYKFILVVAALRHLSMQAMFPRMSSLYAKKKDDFRELCSQAEQVMLAVITPAVIILAFLAPNLITLAYGQSYSAASQVFIYLLGGVWFLYASFVFPNALNVVGKEKQYLWVTVAGAAGNLLFNFLLIPHYGVVGAAIGTIAAESAILISSYIMSRSYTKIRIVPLMAPPITAGAAMIGTIYLLHFPLLYELFAGLVCYAVVLWLVRLWTKGYIISNRGE